MDVIGASAELRLLADGYYVVATASQATGYFRR